MIRVRKKSGWRGRDMVLFAAFLSADLLTKHVYSGWPGAYCNPVGSWGFPIDPVPLLAVSLLSLAVAVIAYRCLSESYRPAVVCIIAGGAGNLVDRIILGCVRDFIYVSWFPTFNVADTLLTLGIVTILILLAKKVPVADV
jgi:hypothetical protein